MTTIKAPIRVLQVLGCLNRGGAETLVVNLFRKIDKTKFQFDFVIHRCGEQAYSREVIAGGGIIYYCPQYKGYNCYQYRKWWENFFELHPEYVIVHGHVPSTASIYLKVAKKYGCIAIAHSHTTSSGRGISSLIKNVLQHSIRRNADFFMGCSRESNEWLFGKKIANNREKCVILKNGIDTTRYTFNEKLRFEKRNELNVSNDIVIGTVGRMEEPKNPLFIVDVVFEAAKICPNVKFVWVGNGSMRQAVEEKIKDLSLSDRFVLVGDVDNVSDYLQAMDMFLFPSLWEGLGMSLVEAQSVGLPCACSDVIPNEAIVTDLVEKIPLTEKPDVWARKCVYRVNKEIRKDQTFYIVKSGYDIQKSVRQLSEVYGALIQNLK